MSVQEWLAEDTAATLIPDIITARAGSPSIACFQTDLSALDCPESRKTIMHISFLRLFRWPLSLYHGVASPQGVVSPQKVEPGRRYAPAVKGTDIPGTAQHARHDWSRWSPRLHIQARTSGRSTFSFRAPPGTRSQRGRCRLFCPSILLILASCLAGYEPPKTVISEVVSDKQTAERLINAMIPVAKTRIPLADMSNTEIDRVFVYFTPQVTLGSWEALRLNYYQLTTIPAKPAAVMAANDGVVSINRIVKTDTGYSIHATHGTARRFQSGNSEYLLHLDGDQWVCTAGYYAD